MKVELAQLRPNPLRDFKIDPLEDDDPAILNSINDTGFWGGVPVRKLKDGTLELAAGHRRVHTAIKAGITHAEVDVKERDDAEMIRIYATENLTQRGEKSGLAMAGAVASAARYLIKAVLRGDNLSQIYDRSERALETIRGQIVSSNGIGAPLILAFYKKHDTIFTESIVRHHVANLKASGDYARIVQEVTEEIEKEAAKGLAELERRQKEAEEKRPETAAKAKAKMEKAKVEHAKTKETIKKAAEAAAKEDVYFDLAGVGKHLKTENQIRAFRNVVKQESVRKHLPVENQAALAAKLAEHAEKTGVELSGKFVQENIIDMIRQVNQHERKIEAQAQKEMEETDVRVKWYNLSHHFARNVLGIVQDGVAMLKLMEKHRDIQLGASKEMRKALISAQEIVNQLADEFRKQEKQT